MCTDKLNHLISMQLYLYDCITYILPYIRCDKIIYNIFSLKETICGLKYYNKIMGCNYNYRKLLLLLMAFSVFLLILISIKVSVFVSLSVSVLMSVLVSVSVLVKLNSSPYSRLNNLILKFQILIKLVLNARKVYNSL